MQRQRLLAKFRMPWGRCDLAPCRTIGQKCAARAGLQHGLIKDDCALVVTLRFSTTALVSDQRHHGPALPCIIPLRRRYPSPVLSQLEISSCAAFLHGNAVQSHHCASRLLMSSSTSPQVRPVRRWHHPRDSAAVGETSSSSQSSLHCSSSCFANPARAPAQHPPAYPPPTSPLQTPRLHNLQCPRNSPT